MKREAKELGMETSPREGVVKDEKFLNTRKPSHQRVCGEFWNLRGQHNWEKLKKKKTKQNKTPTEDVPNLTATPSGEVAQMLGSATSKRGLDREAQAACLG